MRSALLPLSILLLTLIISPVSASSSPYLEGFRIGYAHERNHCSYGGANSPDQDKCVAGFIAGQQKAASLTAPYQYGFTQGQADRLASITHELCDIYPANGNITETEFTPYWECSQGYNAGYAAPVSHHEEKLALISVKQTTAYRTGFAAGQKNESYFACSSFNDRDSKICVNGYDDGYRTLHWSKTAIYNLGYQYGLKAAESGAEGGDEAGDCSFGVVDAKKTAVCEAGWDAGYKAGGGK